MSPVSDDKFKNEYHKFADQQVHNREDNDAIGRLRLALFVAALGPGASILLHTIGYDPARVIRIGILATMPIAIVLLIMNFIRLPGRVKGSKATITIIIMTVVAVCATFPVARHFSLLP